MLSNGSVIPSVGRDTCVITTCRLAEAMTPIEITHGRLRQGRTPRLIPSPLFNQVLSPQHQTRTRVPMTDRRRNTPANRRALKLGVFVEHVDKRKLWMQYQGICALCLKPVKFSRMTIDHIVPLSQGGAHSYENTQPAHSLCNHVKGSGEFSLERLNDAEKRRARRRSKGYRNKTGRRRVPLTPIRAM